MILRELRNILTYTSIGGMGENINEQSADEYQHDYILLFDLHHNIPSR
jgi:hypothetical protein